MDREQTIWYEITPALTNEELIKFSFSEDYSMKNWNIYEAYLCISKSNLEVSLTFFKIIKKLLYKA